eukprot:g6834.t1
MGGAYRGIGKGQVEPESGLTLYVQYGEDGTPRLPAIGSLVVVSELGASLTWRVEGHDKMAPNGVNLRMLEREEHGLGVFASSSYGGTWKVVTAAEGAGGGSAEGQCAEGGEKGQKQPRSAAVMAREQEMRLQAVHASVENAMEDFERDVEPDGSYRAVFTSKPYGISVRGRANWLGWLGDWASYFEMQKAASGAGGGGGDTRGMLRAGDCLVAVNGQKVLGWSEQKLVAMLQGLEPSVEKPVTMLCVRKDWDQHAQRRGQIDAQKARQAKQEGRRQKQEELNKHARREADGAAGAAGGAGDGGGDDGGDGDGGAEKPDFSSANPYDILLVDQDATAEDIKKAYRKLSLQYHPDKNPGDADATRRFIAISAAYELLSDDAKRSEWDDREASRDDFYSDHRGRKVIQAMGPAQFRAAMRRAAKGWSKEGEGVVLVMFYAPWCNHNQKLRRGFMTAAKLLRRGMENLEVAAVNCDRETAFCRDEEGVRGFPTIRLYIPAVGRQVDFTQHERIAYPMIPDLLVAFAERIVERAGMVAPSEETAKRMKDPTLCDGKPRDRCPGGCVWMIAGDGTTGTCKPAPG